MSKELIEMLDTGIELEKKGMITYMNFAHRTKNMTGKDMFIQLAKDEFEHRGILESLRNPLIQGKPLNISDIPMKAIEGLGPKLKNRKDLLEGEKGLSDLDALGVALDLERNSMNYYHELGEKTTEQQVRQLAEKLSKWEQNHYDVIQAEMDHITKTGFYFDMPEFRFKE